MWSRLISSREMGLPVVTFATFQIKTIVKPWDLSGHGFNSELFGVLIHMRWLFMLVFPSEPVELPEHLLCFVFVLDFWKECVSNIDGAMPKTPWWCFVLHNHSQMLSKFYEYTFLIIYLHFDNTLCLTCYFQGRWFCTCALPQRIFIKPTPELCI